MAEPILLELQASVDQARNDVLRALEDIKAGAQGAANSLTSFDLQNLADDLTQVRGGLSQLFDGAGRAGAALGQMREHGQSGVETIGVLWDLLSDSDAATEGPTKAREATEQLEEQVNNFADNAQGYILGLEDVLQSVATQFPRLSVAVGQTVEAGKLAFQTFTVTRQTIERLKQVGINVDQPIREAFERMLGVAVKYKVQMDAVLQLHKELRDSNLDAGRSQAEMVAQYERMLGTYQRLKPSVEEYTNLVSILVRNQVEVSESVEENIRRYALLLEARRQDAEQAREQREALRALTEQAAGTGTGNLVAELKSLSDAYDEARERGQNLSESPLWGLFRERVLSVSDTLATFGPQLKASLRGPDLEEFEELERRFSALQAQLGASATAAGRYGTQTRESLRTAVEALAGYSEYLRGEVEQVGYITSEQADTVAAEVARIRQALGQLPATQRLVLDVRLDGIEAASRELLSFSQRFAEFGVSSENDLRAAAVKVLDFAEAMRTGGTITTQQADLIVGRIGEIRDQVALLPEEQRLELAVEMEGLEATEEEFEQFTSDLQAKAREAGEAVKAALEGALDSIAGGIARARSELQQLRQDREQGAQAETEGRAQDAVDSARSELQATQELVDSLEAEQQARALSLDEAQDLIRARAELTTLTNQLSDAERELTAVQPFEQIASEGERFRQVLADLVGSNDQVRDGLRQLGDDGVRRIQQLIDSTGLLIDQTGDVDRELSDFGEGLARVFSGAGVDVSDFRGELASVLSEGRSLDEVFEGLFTRTGPGLSNAASDSTDLAQGLDASATSAKKLAEDGVPALDRMIERTEALARYTTNVRQELGVITSLLQEIDGLTA